MTSLNDRDAGRDFEGNGPSSFDRRDYRIEAADVAPLSPEKMAAVAAAMAKIDLAFNSPQARENDAKWRAYYAGRKAVAA